MMRRATILLSFIVGVVLLLTGCTASTGGTAEVTTGTPTPTTVAQSSEHFDSSNYATLATDPDAHKGASVEIVGRVFTEVEKDANGTYLQIFADPKNSQWNTVVAYGGALDVKTNDFVKVVGEVKGSLKGQNLMGGTVTAVQIAASSIEKVDGTAAGPAPTRSAIVKKSSNQHDISITVEKVEFTADDTRVFLTVSNGTRDKASFYSFNAKAVQGSKQADAENKYGAGYPEVQSELLPGVKSSGVIAFPALDEKKPLKLVFEAHSDNYELEFQPYEFLIQP